MTAALVPVRRRGVVTFSGGPYPYEASRAGAPRYQVAYDVPRNTCDPRYRQCTDHHVACDCREAELNEQLEEHRGEWRYLSEAARSALAGHQVEHPSGAPDGWAQSVQLCLCSGCVIQRATGNLLRWGDVDWRTGRVKPAEGSLAMGWAPGEVPF